MLLTHWKPFDRPVGHRVRRKYPLVMRTLGLAFGWRSKTMGSGPGPWQQRAILCSSSLSNRPHNDR